MQVTSIGTFSSLSGAQQSESPVIDNYFANLLSSEMKKGALTEQKQEKESLTEEITELVELLQIENITEPEAFLDTVQEEFANGEPFNEIAFILDHLQLSEQDLRSALLSFLAGIQWSEEGSHVGDNEENIQSVKGLPSESIIYEGEKTTGAASLETIKKAVANGKIAESFQLLSSLLGEVDLQQAAFYYNEKSVPAIKFLKLLQLLTQHDLPENEQKGLHALLEKVTGTLDKLMGQEEKLIKRKEWLQQTFAPLVKEGKQGESFFKPYYPPYTVQLKPGEQPHEKQTFVQPLSPLHDVKLPLQPMTRNEPVVSLLEKSGEPVSTERLIAQFERIMANSRLIRTGGTERLFIKLYPEHLGTLKVELIHKESSILAKFTVENNTVKELLESRLQSLRTAFTLQNIPLEKIEITVSMNEQHDKLFDRNREQEQMEQRQQEKKEQKQGDGEDYTHSFAEALINAEV